MNLHRLWPSPGSIEPEELLDLYAPDRGAPAVRANFVTSLDGAAEIAGVSRGLSSDADQLVLRLLRRHADAVVVGAGTLRDEGYGALKLSEESQAWRSANGLAPQPTLVVVSSRLDLDPSHRMFTAAPVRPIVLTHASAPVGRSAALTEGGPHLMGSLLASDLVDELCLTVAPLLAGAGATRIAAGPTRPEALGMRLAHLIMTDENVLLSRWVRAAA